MRTVELFRLSSSALTRHKMRAFLTLLGVIIGVATVVGVVSVISGLNIYVKDKLFGLTPDIVIFTKYGIITSSEEWIIARKRRDVTLTDKRIVVQECRGSAEVGAEGEPNRPVKYLDRKLSDVEIQGHTANMTSLLRVDIATGRYFTGSEYDHAEAVAVLGWDVQDQLFGTQDPIGRIMKIDGYPVKVVGTLVKQGNVMGQSRDNVIYIPLTLFKNHIAPTQDIAIFIKPVGGVEGANAATDEVRTILRHGHGGNAADPLEELLAGGLPVDDPDLRDLPCGRGDRDRQHHVRVGRRANQGDRRPARFRRAAARHPLAVPARSGAAGGVRRDHRRGAGFGHRPGSQPGLPRTGEALLHPHRNRGRDLHRPARRMDPVVEGGRAAAGRSTPL